MVLLDRHYRYGNTVRARLKAVELVERGVLATKETKQVQYTRRKQARVHLVDGRGDDVQDYKLRRRYSGGIGAGTSSWHRCQKLWRG